MPKPVPTPLAAALGLVPTVLGGVRRLPMRIVQLPVLAVGSALTTLDATRRGYDDLAERGERLLASLRGTSFDEVEDRVEDALQGTALARPYDAVEDALEDAGEKAGRALRAVTSPTTEGLETAVEAAVAAPARATRTAAKAPAKATRAVQRAADKAADKAADAADEAAAETTGKATGAAGVNGSGAGTPAAEQPKGAPTPKATQPDDSRIGTAASSEVVQTVEQVAATTGGTVLAHDDLPLADYDHMTLGSLRGRLRSLTVEQLVQVRDYEKAHADRLPVVTMLDNRIAKLANDPSAQPTGGGDGTAPELMPSQVGQGGSKVSPATSPESSFPAPHGVPGNNSPKK